MTQISRPSSTPILGRIKNLSNWVRTIELDKYAHPNGRFSLSNLSDKEWIEFLEKVIENL